MDKNAPILKEPNIRKLLLETDEDAKTYNTPIIAQLLEKYGVQKLYDARKYFGCKDIESRLWVHVDYYSGIVLSLTEIDSIVTNVDGTSNIKLKNTAERPFPCTYTIDKGQIKFDYDPNYYYEYMQKVFEEELELFNASNDNVIFKPEEFRDKFEFLARRLVKSGWARQGDDVQKIVDFLTNELKGIVIIRDGDIVKKKVQDKEINIDADTFSSYGGYIFWTIKKDMRIEFIFHELLHSYFRKYGKKSEFSGISSTLDLCSRGRLDNSVLNMTPEYEEQLKDFESRFSDENAKLGLNFINEGLTNLILFDSIYGDKYFMGEGTSLFDGYFCETLTAELLQKKFGEQLKEMYHSGPVGFEKAFDEKLGKGKFFEFCSKLGYARKELEKSRVLSSLYLTFYFTGYVIDTLQLKLSNSLEYKIFKNLIKVKRDGYKEAGPIAYKDEKSEGTKIANRKKWVQIFINSCMEKSFTYKGKIYSDLYNLKGRRIKIKKESTTARVNRLKQERYKKTMLAKIKAKSKSIQSQGKLPA